jgi:hypothetical protein
MEKILGGFLITVVSLTLGAHAAACPGVTGGGTIEGKGAPNTSGGRPTPGGTDSSDPSTAPPPSALPAGRSISPSASPPSWPTGEADCLKAGGKWQQELRVCEMAR